MFDEALLLEFLNRFDVSKHLKMMDIYITGIEGHIKTCAEALENRAEQKLKGSVHNVKSLCLTLGAQEAGELARQMELDIIDGQEDKAFAQVDTLLAQLEDIKDVISKKAAESA